MADSDLGFEPPAHFIDHGRYVATDQDKRSTLDGVPQIIWNIVMHALPRNPTFDPITPFYFFKTGRLPKWVVKWFLKNQGKRADRLSNMTKFYKAMHLIETLRCFCHDVIQEEEMLPPIATMTEGDDQDNDDETGNKEKGKGKGKGIGKKSKK